MSLLEDKRIAEKATPEKRKPIPDQDNRNANVVSQINSWNGLQGIAIAPAAKVAPSR